MTTPLSDTLPALQDRIRNACLQAGRPPDAARLLAVSKGVAIAPLREALALGQSDFGENYLQEALPKIAALHDTAACWHFIGPVQSNKTRDIAAHFDWVHSVDRLRVAQRLSAARSEAQGPLQVCVQVNVSGEHSKSGVAPANVAELCRAVAALPRLRLRGLMAIPAVLQQRSEPDAPYRLLQTLALDLRRSGLDVDTLSAGMSDDFAWAIAHGATWVRIGTALFGNRKAP